MCGKPWHLYLGTTFSYRAWLDLSIYSSAWRSAAASRKVFCSNHQCNSCHDFRKGGAGKPTFPNDKQEMGGARKIFTDVGQMEGNLQKVRQTSNGEASGRRRAWLVWRICSWGGRRRSRGSWWGWNPCHNWWTGRLFWKPDRGWNHRESNVGWVGQSKFHPELIHRGVNRKNTRLTKEVSRFSQEVNKYKKAGARN